MKTIESLLLTLQKLQQTSDTAQGGATMADLKSILLNRIAELEVVEALESAQALDPTALVPPSPAEGVPPKESTATTDLAKLD